MKSINLIKIKKYKIILNKTKESMKENYDNCDKFYNLFKKLGIKSNIYVNSIKLKYNSRKSNLRKLEWYIGQFMNAYEHKNIYAMMTWENCFDKFVNNKVIY